MQRSAEAVLPSLRLWSGEKHRDASMARFHRARYGGLRDGSAARGDGPCGNRRARPGPGVVGRRPGAVRDDPARVLPDAAGVVPGAASHRPGRAVRRRPARPLWLSAHSAGGRDGAPGRLRARWRRRRPATRHDLRSLPHRANPLPRGMPGGSTAGAPTPTSRPFSPISAPPPAPRWPTRGAWRRLKLRCSERVRPCTSKPSCRPSSRIGPPATAGL